MVEQATVKRCRWHLCGRSLRGRQRVFCSLHCKWKFYVDKRRKDLKRMAIASKGGRCALCGYNSCADALAFHHVAGKDFGIASKGYTRSWERIQAELARCILVCQNCHAEIHAGLYPLQLPQATVVEKSGEFRETLSTITGRS